MAEINPYASLLLGGAIGAASDIGGGFLSQKFAFDAADKSKNITRYFAKRKYQLETGALRRGGLNPILAAGRFGGTTGPSVGSSNVSSGSAAAGASSALQARRMVQELRNLEASEFKDYEAGAVSSAQAQNLTIERQILKENLNSAKAAAAAAKAEEEFWQSEVGKKMKKIDLFFRSLNPMTDAASSAKSATR